MRVRLATYFTLLLAVFLTPFGADAADRVIMNPEVDGNVVVKRNTGSGTENIVTFGATGVEFDKGVTLDQGGTIGGTWAGGVTWGAGHTWDVPGANWSLTMNSDTGFSNYHSYTINDTLAALIGVAGSSDVLINGSSAGDALIRVQSNDLLISTDGGATAAAKIGTSAITLSKPTTMTQSLSGSASIFTIQNTNTTTGSLAELDIATVGGTWKFYGNREGTIFKMDDPYNAGILTYENGVGFTFSQPVIIGKAVAFSAQSHEVYGKESTLAGSGPMWRWKTNNYSSTPTPDDFSLNVIMDRSTSTAMFAVWDTGSISRDLAIGGISGDVYARFGPSAITLSKQVTAQDSVAIKNLSGGVLSLWPDNTGASNKIHLANGGSGELRIWNHGNTSILGSVTQAGAWTLGPDGTTTSNKPTHSIYAKNILIRPLVAATGSGGPAVGYQGYLMWRNRADANKWELGMSEVSTVGGGSEASPSMYWYSYQAGGYVGTITPAGLWTLGAPRTGNNYGGEVHKVVGHLATATVTSPNANDYFLISHNAHYGSSGNRYDSSRVGAALFLEAGNKAFTFSANTAGDSTSTSSHNIGAIAADGSWDLASPSQSVAVTHSLWTGPAAGGGSVQVRTAGLLTAGALNYIGVADGPSSTKAVLGVTYQQGSSGSGYLSTITSGSATAYYIWHSGGTWYTSSSIANVGGTGGTVIGTQTSDERLKENIAPISYGLDTILALKPIEFDREGKHYTGFGAQTTAPVLPTSVYEVNEYPFGEDEPAKLAMDYTQVIAPLVKSVQELNAKLECVIANDDADEAACL